jgi:hypothetical protein
MPWLSLLRVLESWMFFHDMTGIVDDMELKNFIHNWILVLSNTWVKGQSLSLPIDSWVIFIELEKT